MKKIDTLIIHADLFSMQGQGVGFIDDACIAIDRGNIIGVGKTSEIYKDYEAEEIIDAKDKMVLPGFVDAHMHTSCNMMRGIAQDSKNWMLQALLPVRYYVKEKDGIEAAKVNILEALAAGTTTFGDYGVFDHIRHIDDFYNDIGVRANLTIVIKGWGMKQKSFDKEALYDFIDEEAQVALNDNMALYNKWNRAGSKTTVNLGAHAPDTLSKEMLIKCKKIAKENNMKINMHVAQGDRETYQMIKRYGKRSIEFLDDIGYLDKDLIAVHLTEATDEETRLVAKRGASMIVCSGSIGIIDGVVPPAHIFQEAGGNVALGSDQSSGNNCNQIINEMKLTALFNKIKYADPEIMQAWRVLRMATIEGAKAIGLGDKIGSIEAGKKADIIFVDLNAKTMMPATKKPFRTHVPNLVYSARGNEICRVMVDGKTLYINGEFLTVDEKILMKEFKEKAEQLYENTQWGKEIENTIGYKLQSEEKL